MTHQVVSTSVNYTETAHIRRSVTATMLDPVHPLAELLQRDRRYHFDAYVFVFDALRYAQENRDRASGDADQPQAESDEFSSSFDEELEDELDEDFGEEDFSEEGFDSESYDAEDSGTEEQHVSGQELCLAIRDYALRQYGMLAKNVLNHWGVQSTGDFGEIVFNLIDIGQMRKTESDHREDFDDVYDFQEALVGAKVFQLSDAGRESSK